VRLCAAAWFDVEFEQSACTTPLLKSRWRGLCFDLEKGAADRVISLTLGGHPRSSKILALQEWDDENGAIKKDQLERRMRVRVCAEKLSLNAARSAIYFDWQGALRRYMPRSKIPGSISQG